MKRILLLTIIVISYFNLAYPEYFRHLNLEEGLSSPSIFAVTQDKIGRIWIATKEGINVYDGISVRAYKGWVENPQSVNKDKTDGNNSSNNNKIWIGNEATAVVTDAKGNVFFLIDNDVVKFSIRNERFSRITNSGNIRALNAFHGRLIFANKDSIFTMDEKGESIKGVLKLSGIKSINHISADNQNFYLSTRNGLIVLGKNGDKRHTLLPNLNIWSTYISRNGDIWVPTVEEGLYRISSNLKETVSISIPPALGDAVGAAQCRFAIEDHRGKIWFGSFSGLFCYNPKTGATHRINIQRHAGGLSHPSIYGLYLDNKRNLWVSTFYGGVNYFSIENDKFLNFNYDEIIPDEMAHSYIKDMVVDNDGNLWFASDGAGVCCLDPNWNIVTHLSTHSAQNHLCQNNARTLEYDRKRNLLFIGTYMGGLSIYNLNTKQTVNLINDPKFKNTVGGVIHNLKLHDNKLFISSDMGLAWLDLDSKEISHINVDKTSKLFDIGKDGTIYSTSADYREAYMVSNPTSLHPKVTSLIPPDKGMAPTHICVTNKGVLIGSLGNGIIFLPFNSSKPVYLNTSNHRFPDDYIYGFSIGKKEEVYASTRGNIVKINMNDLSTQSLNFNNYFPGTHLIDKCALLVLNNNEIAVGSTKGLSFINPDEFTVSGKSADSPKIYFSRLRIQNRDILPNDGTGILKEALPFSSSIHLPHDKHDISLIIGVSDYRPSTGVAELEYTMDGVDKEWYSTTDNKITYRNLKSGSYLLRVRHHGGDQEISIRIVVATPWYLRWWAWLLYIVIATSLAFVIIRKSLSEAKLRGMLEEANLEREQLEKVNQILRGPVSTDDVIENPMDRKLVESVIEVIDRHLDDSELDVLLICKEIGMSRSLFFNKFKAITGLTPKTFILNYRLKHASTLLIEQPHLNIAEIAYQSGFSTAAYFSRCFKKQFGVSPASYRKDSPESSTESSEESYDE